MKKRAQHTNPKRQRGSARREAGVFIPTGRGRAVEIGGQLDVARCPLCDGPMTPRLSREGSYFHCRCHEVKKEQATAVRAVLRIENKRLAGSDSPLQLAVQSCNNNLSSVG